jgi:hypothetical protein
VSTVVRCVTYDCATVRSVKKKELLHLPCSRGRCRRRGSPQPYPHARNGKCSRCIASKITFSSSLFRSSKTSSHYFPKETRGGEKKGQPAMCGGTHRPKSLATPPPPEEKRSLFECFPYVRPEPVLVKCSFIYINGSKRRSFLKHSPPSAIDLACHLKACEKRHF